jgi:hypothetical protein
MYRQDFADVGSYVGQFFDGVVHSVQQILSLHQFLFYHGDLSFD